MNLEEIIYKLELIESMLFTLLSEENKEIYRNQKIEKYKAELKPNMYVRYKNYGKIEKYN